MGFQSQHPPSSADRNDGVGPQNATQNHNGGIGSAHGHTVETGASHDGLAANDAIGRFDQDPKNRKVGLGQVGLARHVRGRFCHEYQGMNPIFRGCQVVVNGV